MSQKVQKKVDQEKQSLLCQKTASREKQFTKEVGAER